MTDYRELIFNSMKDDGINIFETIDNDSLKLFDKVSTWAKDNDFTDLLGALLNKKNKKNGNGRNIIACQIQLLGFLYILANRLIIDRLLGIHQGWQECNPNEDKNKPVRLHRICGYIKIKFNNQNSNYSTNCIISNQNLQLGLFSI